MSVLLLVFSAYVYWSYAEFQTQEFAQRLVRKAELLYQVLDDTRVDEALATLSEQAGYIYSPTAQLVYASPNAGDYRPSPTSLTEVRQQRRVALDFSSPNHLYSEGKRGAHFSAAARAGVLSGHRHGLR